MINKKMISVRPTYQQSFDTFQKTSANYSQDICELIHCEVVKMARETFNSVFELGMFSGVDYRGIEFLITYRTHYESAPDGEIKVVDEFQYLYDGQDMTMYVKHD